MNAPVTLEDLQTEVDPVIANHTRIMVSGAKLHTSICTFGDLPSRRIMGGIALEIRPWSAALEKLRKSVIEASGGEPYNFCLVNKYSGGSECIGPHKDDNSLLIAKSSIACWSQ